MKLILIGLRGSGKSAVGARAADALGLPLVDLDERVARRAGRSIARIFAEQGEPAFRALEKQLVAEALREDGRAVIATGGGVVLDAENVAALRRAGFVVWLTADAAVLTARVAADAATRDDRPSLTGRPPGEELADVARAREPLYAAAAHWRLDTGGLSLEETAVRVAEAYRRRLADPPEPPPTGWI